MQRKLITAWLSEPTTSKHQTLDMTDISDKVVLYFSAVPKLSKVTQCQTDKRKALNYAIIIIETE